jgi:Holliday junction DNA helicase RuvA
VIASIRGPVADVGLDRVIVEVGGVGMLVQTTPGTAAALRRGVEARLATSLVVREDSLTLFGFASEDEREIFEQVQTVAGVGPRLALAMLAVLSPERIRAAIGSGQVAELTKVPGIGKKGAERMVLELRDRMAVHGSPADGAAQGAVAGMPADGAWRGQVTEALLGLGWSARQAEEAVATVAGAAPVGGAASVSEMLRAALRELGR